MTGRPTIRIISFLLLAACPAFCQGSDARQVESLPDAPSPQIGYRQSVGEPSLPSQISDAAAFRAYLSGSSLPESEAEPAASEAARTSRFDFGQFNRPAQPGENHDAADDFFKKYLAPQQGVAHIYRASTSDSLFGRATYAASSIVLTRDQQGNSRLNTSYLLRVLTAAVAHSAYRPYWKRSLSQPFSEFGTTIGDDAGMHVFQEFKPGILQLVKTHEPKFVSRIEQHFEQK